MTVRTRTGKPIWRAYQDVGALRLQCPHCDAQPGQWCTRDDGRLRRTPCLARIPATSPHDFGEPRHPEQNGD